MALSSRLRSRSEFERISLERTLDQVSVRSTSPRTNRFVEICTDYGRRCACPRHTDGMNQASTTRGRLPKHPAGCSLTPASLPTRRRRNPGPECMPGVYASLRARLSSDLGPQGRSPTCSASRGGARGMAPRTQGWDPERPRPCAGDAPRLGLRRARVHARRKRASRVAPE
jgi:hypothetical protein